MSDDSRATQDPQDPQIPPRDAVIPPDAPETPIPEGLLTDVPDIPIADAVIPPPPPELMPSSRRTRPKPAILDDDAPSAAAEDWARPSVAPEVPLSGGYRGFSIAVFGVLFLLLAAAVVVGIYLVTSTTFPFAAADPLVSIAVTSLGGALPL